MIIMITITILSLVLLASSVLGQATTTAVCATSFSWANNDEGESPCQVASNLQAVCNGGSWSVPYLPAGQEYIGPTADQDNGCLCNTVVYNLIAACADCQDGQWVPWSQWIGNCTESVPVTYYPMPIPADTSIPAWALLNTAATGTWSPAAANLTASSSLPDTFPSSTTISSQVRSTAAALTSSSPFVIGASSTPQFTAASTAAAATAGASTGNSSSSNTGAIAGGVVGGLAALAIIGLLIFFLMRRNKSRVSTAPSAYPSSTQGPKSDMAQYAAVPTTAQQPQAPYQSWQPPAQTGTYTSGSEPYTLYNPTNPSTYPSSQGGYSSTNPTPAPYSSTNLTPAPTHYTSPSPQPPNARAPYGGYPGVAEV